MKATTLKTPKFQLQIVLILAVLASAASTASAAQAVWQAVVNTSADTNWSNSANWVGGTLPSGNNSVFNDATGVGNNTTINNVVNTPEFPLSLLYTNIGTYQNTLILPGDTLTIGTGGLLMTNALGQLTNPPVTITTISGSTLITSNDTLNVGYAFDTTSRTGPTLNMSGLANFIGTNMNRILVGAGAVRLSGIVYLAATNNVNFTGASSSASPNLEIGFNSSNNGPPSFLYLGQTNLFFVNDIGMGLQKQNGTEMEFNSAFNNPVAYFYGTNGVGSLVSTWAIADGQATGGTTTAAATADFTGGAVYANVNNMWIGRSSSAENGGSPTDEGTLTFGAGQINVNNMTNGWITSAAESTTATSTINVNGTGVLSVGGNLVLAVTNSGLTYTTHTVEAQAELNITGGSVLANRILTGGLGNNGNGNGAYIQMIGGLLAVTNTMGSSVYPINYLVLASSPTLQLGVVNNVINSQVQNLYAFDGSTAVINISSLPVVPTFPTQYPLITYQSQPNGNQNFSLGTMPGTYMGYISNDNSSTVWLVVTNGPAVPQIQWGGGVNGNWDTTTKNWTNNGVAAAYAENDSVYFNDQAQTATVNLTAPHTPFGLAVTNDVLNYTFTGSGVGGGGGLIKAGTASLTLSESGDNFIGGISLVGGTLVLDQSSSSISGGLSIDSGATAQIGNNDANGTLPAGPLVDSGTLAYDQIAYTLQPVAVSGTGGLTQEGSGTLALSAANTYTGNTLVSKGTLALTNSGSISDSAAVSVNNATLDVSAETSVSLNNLTLANASINMNVAYQTTPVNVAGLSLGGSGNTINIASLPVIATYPATMTLVQSAGAISGSDISLGTVPSASPAYAGSVSVSGNQVVLTLTGGPIGVRPYVSWSGADVPNLHTNWSDNANWLTPGAPTPADSVIFNDTADQTSSALSAPGGGSGALEFPNINNIVDANSTISTLVYTNVGGLYQNTLIATGKALTITNSNTNGIILAVGSSTTDFGSSATENATISGPNSALNVDNTNATIFVGLVTGGAGTEQATLDMSALGSFNASVSSFAVGAVNGATLGTIGTAYLARTNVITAVGGTNLESGQNENLSFMVGETGKNGAGECFLFLGQQNTINANYIGVSLAKEPAELEFNTNNIWPNPSASIRGADGVSPVAVWAIGDALAQTGGSAKPTGIADFTGGTVNALVNTMYIGRSPNASGPNPATGTLAFDAGTFAVGTIYDGYQAFGTSDNGVGTINVGTGLLQVGTLNLALTTSGESSPTTGALNITNGTAQLGTVVCDSHAAGQSTINLVNGTLVITNTAGSTGAPLTALSLTGGTLQLDVNGAANAANIVATAVTTSGTTTLKIGSLSGVSTGVTYPLISYTGTDPYSSLSLSLPAGYQGTLVDNSGLVGLQLTVVPVTSSPRFTGISVSGTTLSVAGTNGVPNGTFILLESTSIAPPVHWTPAWTNSYDAHGAFNLSANILSPATPHMFFTLTNVP